MFTRAGIAGAVAGAMILCGAMPANATFLPVLDEFWVIKNGSEVFRDSFNDGAPAPSGPEDAITGTGDTYTVIGGGGVVSESGGKLLLDPSLGIGQLNPEGNLNIRTEVRRQRSTNPLSSAFLGFSDSFEISTLYDLSSLPDVAASGFGVRLSDQAPGNANGGNDILLLEVARGRTSGQLGILYSDIDFGTNNVETFDFIALDPILGANPTAEQIQLTLTKDANSNIVGGYFTLFDGIGTTLLTQTVDNVGNDNGLTASIYDGENFTRAAFAVRTQIEVPEPGMAGIFVAGILAMAAMRRRT